MVFFETLWPLKKVSRFVLVGGVLILAAVGASLTAVLLNTVFLLFVSLGVMFAASLYFASKLTSKVLFSLLAVAILTIAEMLVATAFFNVLGVEIEQVQENILMYFLGVITSNMLALLVVFFIIILIQRYKKEENNNFNLIMAFMPAQAIISCFLVFAYSMGLGPLQTLPLGIISILVSLLLVFIAMFIVMELQKAIEYKGKYDLAELRNEEQVAYYEKRHKAQSELREIRHDLNNNLTAIYGLLESERIEEAKEHIKRINSDVTRSASVINTGIPTLDAVIDAKMDRAKKYGIKVISKVGVARELKLDSFDLAKLVANALDNAIEGVLRSDSLEHEIYLNISDEADFISIIVENYASEPINEDFQTSKADKQNHGFGIKQIRDITKKYNGDVKIKHDADSKKFLLTVLLENEKV
jgi:signal transduction histidine kinase